MTARETLQKHETQCRECERVRLGHSPFCSCQKVLVIFASDEKAD